LLSRLAVHYYRPDFTQSQSHLLIEDMLEDLQAYPVAEVEVAIRTYRLDASQKFFPRAASLIAIIDAERRHRAQVNKPRAQAEFGDSRPCDWEYTRKQFWEPHWHADDLNRATDPDRRKRYDAWLAKKESSDAT